MAHPSLPKTIKAVHQPDPKSTTLLLSETPLPVPSGPHEHLIKVKATSPCLHELTWELNFPDVFPPDRERVPCTECSGIVVSAPGASQDPGNSSPFKPGDEVFFRMIPRRAACLREYTIAMTSELALKPRALTWEQAGATPLSSLTAYQGLFRHGLLDPAALRGDIPARQKNSTIRVLVTGAGGGVGSWAVQLAAAAGAGGIVAVSSPAKQAALLAAGATEISDYTRQSLREWVAEEEGARTCDMALDCAGGASLEGCWSVVREGGVIVSAADAPEGRRPQGLEEKGMAKSEWFLMDPSGRDLGEIAAVVEDGRAVPWIDSVYEFEQYEEAFARVDSGKARGKVVIKVDC